MSETRIEERKWRGDFRKRTTIKGTGKDREGVRKIFERGAGSGQRNARLHNEGRVQGE
jgi:hypothetical protein